MYGCAEIRERKYVCYGCVTRMVTNTLTVQHEEDPQPKRDVGGKPHHDSHLHTLSARNDSAGVDRDANV